MADASETKELLHELGAFQRVLPLIFTDAIPTVTYALGAVQNMLVRPEYARYMREIGADVRLRALSARSPDVQIRQFAEGALSNMTAVLSPQWHALEASLRVPPGTSPTTHSGLASGGHGTAMGIADSLSTLLSPLPAGHVATHTPLGCCGGVGASSERPAALMRAHVAADNSCLFTSVAYLVCDTLAHRKRHGVSSGRSPGALAAPPPLTAPPDMAHLSSLARQLRRECANCVAASPDSATTLALLG